jgi:glucose-6-phosphate isomerase
MSIELQSKFTRESVRAHEVSYLGTFIPHVHAMLHEKTGQGHAFTGWLDLPSTYDKAEFTRLKEAANRIQAQADVLVVIGIGGSYLGARAVIEALSGTFYNEVNKTKIIFAGNQMSGTYMQDLLTLLQDKEWAINVISKSGTTTEPAIAFRILKKALEEKYGAASTTRIYATTDAKHGALKTVASEAGYETFVIPDDVGGRFSVLTPVGLLPIAVAGIDIDALMQGAQNGQEKYAEADYEKNIAYQYAILRNALYNKGRSVELLASYEPRLQYFSEWWKQLFGESEGKDQKGIFPTSAQFSTDLHSLGQFIQDGHNILFETIIHIKRPPSDVEIGHDVADLDGLNFIAGKTMNDANAMAFQGTLLAHTDAHVPNLVLELEQLDALHLGELIYFFELAAAVSGYLLGVNPFDQPGVEAYKKNMFALLGKPGYEALQSELKKRLED